MNVQFKYKRALKFLELNYYSYEKENFVRYFNDFLEEYDLAMKYDEEKTFENCMNYLKSISYIMVERFLCSYYLYCERGQKAFYFYDLSILEWFNKQSITMRIILNHDYKTQHHDYPEPVKENILYIKMNKEGIFYTNKPKNWSLFKILNKPEADSRYFINVKDLGEYLRRTREKLTKDEIKDIKSFYKKIIGKPIENSYELY